MKKLFFLTCFIMGAMVVAPPKLVAQVPYSFVYSYLDSLNGDGAIHKISTTTAVASYRNAAGQWKLSLLSLTGAVNEVQLADDVQQVMDIKDAGGYVFFCGQKGGKGFVGNILLSDMQTPNPVVNYVTPNDDVADYFHALVAYRAGAGEKVVAVGRNTWTDSPTYGTCDYFPPYMCVRRPIVEIDFIAGNVNNFKLWTTDDTARVECAEEVIETPGYVAIVCYYTDKSAISIHRCDKNDVYGTFSDYYYYDAIDEGHSFEQGCYMYGEVIGLSSRSTYIDATGQEQFTTKIRVIDLASMTNLYAQHMPLYAKTDPYELVYVPNGQHLVLLQEAVDPATLVPHCYFTNIYYTTPAAYVTKCWYEACQKMRYTSADMLTSDHLIASGGDQFLLQNATALVSPNSSYTVDNRQIIPLATEPLNFDTYTYTPLFTSCSVDPQPSNVSLATLPQLCPLP